MTDSKRNGMYARPTILLVDDNPHIRSFIKPALEDSGFKCVEAANGEEAVYQVEETHPDLIVLDIELGDPDMDGVDTCKRIRSLGFNMPVIFLTVRATIEDLERGLHLADDYVGKLEELRQIEGGDLQIAVKGPDTRALIARIGARLPRDIQELGTHLRFTRKQRKVEHLIAGRWEEAHLTPLEYETFKTLVDADEAVVGTLDLLDRVFQGGSHDSEELGESALDNDRERVWVCISNIRRKIDPHGDHDYIKNLHGVGYRFSTSD